MIGIMNTLPVVFDQNTALINGVKNGQFNQDEFVALAAKKNEIAEAQAKLDQDKGGLMGAINKVNLEAKQKQYDQLYQTYKYGDYHPQRDPFASQTQQRQLDQLGRIYGGLTNGSITRYEGRNLLNEQQGIARDKVFNPSFTDFGIIRMPNDDRQNQLLNRSSHHIYEAKHNFATDFWPAFPMMF